ncbi:hypothetical protein [Pantoea vagans]|uniref:hypothetical protein n=1 Tax=Pantoea vagans TaxID=470934 RepID=UPI003019FB1C
MLKLIKHWNVNIMAASDCTNNQGMQLVGCQRSPYPVIEQGFLMFENLEGAQAGLNLRDVLAFSIDPQFVEET